ncbi:MAG TPA: LacI family DNA-binding transcriptional regulator [Bacillota bacterium]|nr:LacI family DNA-binding transcriptional regulator [Bacillota bacterium]
MATIRDVANEAHVSIATVSRVIKKSGAVSEDTKKNVYAAIEKLNYMPPSAARKLATADNTSLLVLFPNTLKSIHSETMEGIKDSAKQNDIMLYYAMCENDHQRETAYVNAFKRGQFSGIIFMGTFLQANELNTLSKTHNIALCGENVESANVLSFVIDFEKAAYEAVSHLISCGHKKIAMITTHRRVWSSVFKENGYRRAFKEHGLPYEDEYIFFGRFGIGNARYIVNYFESLDVPPTAYFCISDDIARSVANVLLERNYNFGTDIAICGFDDSEASTSAYPLLTTISQPFYDLGYKVVEVLSKNVSSAVEHKEITYMEHKLFIRESTGAPPVNTHAEDIPNRQ